MVLYRKHAKKGLQIIYFFIFSDDTSTFLSTQLTRLTGVREPFKALSSNASSRRITSLSPRGRTALAYAITTLT